MGNFYVYRLVNPDVENPYIGITRIDLGSSNGAEKLFEYLASVPYKKSIREFTSAGDKFRMEIIKSYETYSDAMYKWRQVKEVALTAYVPYEAYENCVEYELQKLKGHSNNLTLKVNAEKLLLEGMYDTLKEHLKNENVHSSKLSGQIGAMKMTLILEKAFALQ